MAPTGWTLALALLLARIAQEPTPPRTYRPGETAVTKAIELRVESVTTATEIAGRRARPGYEFVIVDTLWKNIIPLTAINKKAASSPTGGLSGFGELCAGVAFLEVFTREDDPDGDRQGFIARRAAWYREAFAQAGFVSCGSHGWLSPSLRDEAAALERADRA